MPNKRFIEVDSVYEYLKQIDNYCNKWHYPSGFIWYRGVNDFRRPLVPGVVWRKIKNEEYIISEFLVNFKNLNTHNVEDSWELYTLMQHYRLPTRLLDWSKSPLVSLFFALEGEVKKNSKRCVWVLDPSELNTKYYDEGILVPRDEYTSDKVPVHEFLPSTLRKKVDSKLPSNIPIPAKHPIAIEPVLNNSRILNQQGCFTIHPEKCSDSLQELLNDENMLFGITIKNEKSAKTMLKSLQNYGIREEIIYQDMDTLSRRIIREKIGM